MAIHLPLISIKPTTENFFIKQITLKIENLEMSLPQKVTNSFMSGSFDTRLYPWECRMMGISYSASLNADLLVKYDSEDAVKMKIKVSTLPVMVGSNRCNLFSDASRTHFVLNREDLQE